MVRLELPWRSCISVVIVIYAESLSVSGTLRRIAWLAYTVVSGEGVPLVSDKWKYFQIIMVLERSFCPKFTLVWAPAVALRPDSKFSFF